MRAKSGRLAPPQGFANDFPPGAHNGNIKNDIPLLPAQSVSYAPGVYPKKAYPYPPIPPWGINFPLNLADYF
jgi:hypothetical protein